MWYQYSDILKDASEDSQEQFSVATETRARDSKYMLQLSRFHKEKSS